jgi:hypothetical protein
MMGSTDRPMLRDTAPEIFESLRHALILQAILDEMWDSLEDCELVTADLCARYMALAREGCKRLIEALRSPLEARGQ